MADVQKQFEQFHNAIRTDYDLNVSLREKRDRILNRVRDGLSGKPSFDQYLQGSYAMKTGVNPLEGKEPDIDVGLKFNMQETDYTAETVRGWVFEAVKSHTEDVKAKGPCIRVTYAAGYHVDLVVYAVWKDLLGREHWRLGHRSGWRLSDPPGLRAHIENAQSRFKGTEGNTGIEQLRRVIRYLKRWDDLAHLGKTTAKPSGLAYTLLSVKSLERCTSWDGISNDRDALRRLAQIASSQTRLVARKPTPEHEDMFGQLTAADMAALLVRFKELEAALVFAGEVVDPIEACTRLRSVFGDDFPVPPPDSTGTKTKRPAVVASSSSA